MEVRPNEIDGVPVNPRFLVTFKCPNCLNKFMVWFDRGTEIEAIEKEISCVHCGIEKPPSYFWKVDPEEEKTKVPYVTELLKEIPIDTPKRRPYTDTDLEHEKFGYWDKYTTRWFIPPTLTTTTDNTSASLYNDEYFGEFIK